MTEKEIHLVKAHEEASQYLHEIGEAMESAGPDEMREHVEEAMPFAQNVLDQLEEVLDATEDADTADRAEEAMHHIGVSMDQGDQALESPEDEIQDIVLEMRKHVEQSMICLNEAIGIAP